MQKVDFKVKVGDEEKNFFVKLPDGKLRKEAREAKAKYFRVNAFKEDCVFSHQIPDLLKRKGLWSNEKDEEIKTVSSQIEEKVRLLSKGKSDKVPTKEALKEIIIKEVKPLRSRQIELLTEYSQLDGISIEKQSEQAEFNYLVAKSTFTDLGDPVYSSVEDYVEKADEPYSELAGAKLAELINNTGNTNWFADLPENKLLIKHKFMDTQGRYIDSEGNLVNSDGKRINDKGFFVNDKGEQIDSYGNLINDDGDVIEYVDFE